MSPFVLAALLAAMSLYTMGIMIEVALFSWVMTNAFTDSQ